MPHRNEELILTVLYELKSKIQGTGRISVTHVLNELKDIIVEEYDGNLSIEEYKNLWVTRIRNIASNHKFNMATKAPSWGRVEPLLISKSSGNASSSSSALLQPRAISSFSTSSVASSSSSSLSSLSSLSSSSSST